MEGAAAAQRERQGGVAKKVDVTTIIREQKVEPDPTFNNLVQYQLDGSFFRSELTMNECQKILECGLTFLSSEQQ